MRHLSPPLWLCLAATQGCGPDNQFHVDKEGEDYAARILVDPVSLDFGALDMGQSATDRIHITNVGNATLYVESMSVLSSGAFTLLGSDEEIALGIEETASVDVVYTSQREYDVGTISILSTDPGQPEVSVALSGAGLFPALELSPENYDLGEHLTACGAIRAELTLKNEGLGLATVDAIAVTGGTFTVVEPATLPLTLAPNDEIPVVVEANPGEDGEWSGTVYVSSDDPAGAASSELRLSTETWTNEDSFHQGDWAQTDVVLTVDRSCSMEDDTERLSSELPTLVSALDEAGTDFQIAVITADDGCHNETLFSPRTEDAESLFRDALFGTSGSFTEAGLTLAYSALEHTDAGACNDGLVREGARVSIVHVSEPVRQSPHRVDMSKLGKAVAD